MHRSWLAVAAYAALLTSALVSAQGPHMDTSKIFNGASLSGWRPVGAAEWRVANGEMLGRAGSAPGYLALEKRYQDVILRFLYQCQNCDAGVIVRNAESSSAPGTTNALYVALSGPDAVTLSGVMLDGQGKILDRQQLYKWDDGAVPVGQRRASRNPALMQLRVRDAGSGWKEVRLQVRRWTAPGATGAAQPQTPTTVYATYGTLGFRLASGELRVKDVVLTDLLRPPVGVAAEVTSPNFRKIQLTDRFYAEGVSSGDVNRDGAVDVLSGPYAYLGPDFKRSVEIHAPQAYAIANATMGGQYTDNFLNYVHDFDGDGWADYLKINFGGAYLYVNPKGESRYWPSTQVTEGVSAETTRFGDLDGDGKPELLGSTGSGAQRVVGYWKPAADPTQRWPFVAVSEKADWGGHGYGFGDLNGDGRSDIIQGSGWWEQPAAGAGSGPWTFHAVPFGRGTDPFVRGADMFAYDVSGDGLNDVVTSLFAHGHGLAWYEQQRSTQGEITWKMHLIMDDPDDFPEAQKAWEITDKGAAFTELHALDLVDMDGDGLKDIVTGKRWFSHGMEYVENDHDSPAVMAWFKTVRRPGGRTEFVPHIINTYVGLGTQIAVADVNNDRRPDVLTAARKGAYVFLNLR